MPSRRVSGLGGSKIPLRGLANLFQELDPSAKSRLISAFADAENLIDFHQRGVSERQTRRRISGRIAKIALEAEANLLGAFLSWNRLEDPRIAFYEVQLSDTSNFATFETRESVENFLIFENLRTAKYARVRGVTIKGDTGLWSNTATLRPRTSAPDLYSVEFYQNYESDSRPNLSGDTLIYSGGLDVAPGKAHPEFYSVFSESFYADLLIGGLSVWGYMSSRLQEFADDGESVWDRVRFRVNGITRMDGYFPHWAIVPDETDFHTNQRDSNGDPMSFYALGGYTASFGPYAVVLPNTLSGVGEFDAHSVVQMEVDSGVFGRFYWEFPQNAASASRFDQGQLTAFDDDTVAHEAVSRNIEEGAHTDWLVFRDFRLNVPSTSTITGVGVKVKRRQNSPFQNPIPKDNGYADPLMPFLRNGALVFGDDRDITFENGDIFQAIDDNGKFGRYLHSTGVDNEILSTSTNGSNDLQLGLTGNAFTVAFWMINELITVPGSDNEELFFITDGGLAVGDSAILARRRAGSNSHQFQVLFTLPGSTVTTITVDNFFLTSNEFIHVGIVWDGTQISIYKNGDLVSSTTVSGNPFSTTTDFRADLYKGVGLGGISVTGGLSQFGFWDKELDFTEIRAIWRKDLTIDLRFNFNSYQSADKLLHYWLFLPDQADIRDYQVCLVDSVGTIQTGTNKAVTDESWPQLSDFFYTPFRQFGILPLGVAGGVPHDNHVAIGYQDYGGETDLWPFSFLSPAEVNSFYFGVAIRAINEPQNGFPGTAYVDHAKMTVFTYPERDREVTVDVEVAAANQFYLQREVFGGLLNVLELGERLVDLP